MHRRQRGRRGATCEILINARRTEQEYRQRIVGADPHIAGRGVFRHHRTRDAVNDAVRAGFRRLALVDVLRFAILCLRLDRFFRAARGCPFVRLRAAGSANTVSIDGRFEPCSRRRIIRLSRSIHFEARMSGVNVPTGEQRLPRAVFHGEIRDHHADYGVVAVKVYFA